MKLRIASQLISPISSIACDADASRISGQSRPGLTEGGMTMTKEKIIDALRAFVRARPGLSPCNYGSLSSYREESRMISQQLRQAHRLLDAVARRSSITAADIRQAARMTYSGRLSIQEKESGEVLIDYIPGQYYPTEYRAAVCAVLAAALWARYRAEPFFPHIDVRIWARREFGPAIADRWFM
jgi:hypothetical protein